MTADRPPERAPRQRPTEVDQSTPPVAAPGTVVEAGRPESAPARPPRPRPAMPEYRGGELDPDRGPGLGCFWFQVAVLAVFLVLVPIGYNLNWPFEVLAVLLFIILGLLLFVGQTLIFLLRLVAADRRTTGRRRPLASTSKTVGQLEDERLVAEARHPAARLAGAEIDAPASDAPEAPLPPEASADGGPSPGSDPGSAGAGQAQPGPGGMRE